jgi:hypothetical protein
VVAVVVAATQGSSEAAGQLAPILQHLSGQEDWRTLAAVLGRILNGEREIALLAGLDQTDTIIAGNILRALGLRHPALDGLPLLVETGEPSPAEEQPEPSGQSLNDFLNGLFNGVMAVSTGQAPAELGVQLHAVTRALAGDPDMPAELQALGRTLNAILSGDHDPDLSALPPELAAAVRQVLGEIT